MKIRTFSVIAITQLTLFRNGGRHRLLYLVLEAHPIDFITNPYKTWELFVELSPSKVPAKLEKSLANPIKPALEYKNLLEESSSSKQVLADKLGSSRARITQILNLLNLEQEIKNYIIGLEGKQLRFFSERRLRPLVKIKDSKLQKKKFHLLVKDQT